MFALQLLNNYNSLTHYAKGTSFFTDCFTHITSNSFHSIFYGSFHLFPHGTISLLIILVYFIV